MLCLDCRIKCACVGHLLLKWQNNEDERVLGSSFCGWNTRSTHISLYNVYIAISVQYIEH